MLREVLMLRHNILSKKFTTVSSLALSAVLLSSLFITPSWAMIEEDEKSIISTKKKTSIEDLPKVILLKIMNHEGVTEALAPVSKRFHFLSCDKSVARTIFINSQEKLQQILKPRTLPSLPSIEIWLPDQFTVEDLKNIMNIHSNLSSLLMSWNMKKEDSISISNILETNKTLEALELIQCNIDEEGVITIFKSLAKNSTLRELGIGVNPISEKGGIAIGEMLKTNKSLKKLILEGCNMDDKTGIAIGESLKTNTTLEELALECSLMREGSHIGEEGGEAIGKSLEINKALKGLYLGGNPIGEKGGTAIGESLKINSTLKKLNISGCNIGEEASITIGESLETSNSLKKLVLSNNPLGEKGILAMSKGFQNNKSLKVLDLRRIKICDEAAKIIGEALEMNSTLEELYLDDEGIGEEGDIAISKGLENNKTLKILDMGGYGDGMGGYGISEITAKALGNMLKTSSALKVLRLSYLCDEDVLDICNGLETNSSLEELSLRIDDEKGFGMQNIDIAENIDMENSTSASKSLNNMLKLNSTLKVLRFKNSNISSDSIIDICSDLENNKTLKALSLRGCMLYTSSVSIFEKFLEKNPTFRIWEGGFVGEDKIVSEAKKNNLTFIISPDKRSYIDYNDVDHIGDNFVLNNELEEEGSSSEGVGNLFEEEEN
jgi:Ran GTPase-activating protein (RanGAP) involved in mRNA processing and transport